IRDQAALVREATKWDYELRFPEQAPGLVDRALAIAMSEPRGPVHMPLTDLSPSPDFAAIASASRALGLSAGNQDEFRTALETALEHVTASKGAALIDVTTRRQLPLPAPARPPRSRRGGGLAMARAAGRAFD